MTKVIKKNILEIEYFILFLTQCLSLKRESLKGRKKEKKIQNSKFKMQNQNQSQSQN